MTTYQDDPPRLTTMVPVQHRIPVGSKFKATHGKGRVGRVLAVELLPMGPCYKVAYDDAPTEIHYWNVRDELRFTWWDS